MDYIYPVVVSIDEDGRHLVTFPDFPLCATDGETRREALTEAVDVLEEGLAYCINHKERIPVPSARRGRPVVAPGARIAAKVALYQAFREAGISKSELARRLGVDHREARRLLDPRHGSSLDRLDEAVTALDKRLVVSLQDAA